MQWGGGHVATRSGRDAEGRTRSESRARTIRQECDRIAEAAQSMRTRAVHGRYAGTTVYGYDAVVMLCGLMEVIAGDTSTDTAAAQRTRHAALSAARCILRDPDDEPADEVGLFAHLPQSQPIYSAHLPESGRVRRNG